jgi:hypothetical protein
VVSAVQISVLNVKRNAMKTCRQVLAIASTIDEGESLASCPGSFIPWEKAPRTH